MRKIIVKNYDIDRENLSENWKGFSFVVISDYHNNNYGVDVDDLLAKLDALKPEFVVVAGDIVTARPGHSNNSAYELISRIAEKYVVYYGNGNHEYRMRIYPETYGTMYDDFLKCIDSNPNVIHLVNETAVFEKYGERIFISGLEIDREYYKRFRSMILTKEYMESKLGKLGDGEYRILIAHNPKYFKGYADYGANLIFSGHVHGGLVRLPLLGGVVSPDIRLFPKYDYGRYVYNKSTMILTSGAGAHTLKLRLFNPPEMVCVTFR